MQHPTAAYAVWPLHVEVVLLEAHFVASSDYIYRGAYHRWHRCRHVPSCQGTAHGSPYGNRAWSHTRIHPGGNRCEQAKVIARFLAWFRPGCSGASPAAACIAAFHLLPQRQVRGSPLNQKPLGFGARRASSNLNLSAHEAEAGPGVRSRFSSFSSLIRHPATERPFRRHRVILAPSSQLEFGTCPGVDLTRGSQAGFDGSFYPT